MKYFMHGMILAILFSGCRKSAEFSVPETRSQLKLSKGYQLETLTRLGGSPTLVFLNGTESPLESWREVTKRLSPGTAYLAYNRPGTGLSDNIDGVRDALSIAQELKDLLQSADVAPPYILVGHSMGGLYARMYYHLYPADVQGIVLVDASHEKRMDTLISLLPEDQRLIIRQILAEQHEMLLNEKPAGAIREEYRANFSTNYAQISAYPAITQIPLYVLTSLKEDADQDATVVAIQKALHQQWASAAGNNGKFEGTTQSGHYIQLDEPERVVSAINWVLKK